MEDIIIREKTTYQTIDVFNYLVGNGTIVPKDIVSVRIKYDIVKGLPDWESKVEDYPVIMYTCYGQKIHIYCLTVGYGGSGPHATYDILEKSGFNIEKDIIFGKNPTNLWHFNKK